MVTHANLTKTQQTNIEKYKKLSLQEIESSLRSANLSLKDLESRLTSEFNDDIAPEDRDAYINICKEIYKSKKTDELIETYKDYTAQEMCDEINESDKPSELLLEIYQEVGILKGKAEIDEWIVQHDGIFNQDEFYESRMHPTVPSKLKKSGKSSAK